MAFVYRYLQLKTITNVKFHKLLPKTSNHATRHLRFTSATSTNLKEILNELIPQERDRINAFRNENKGKVMDCVMVKQIYGGMRDIRALVCETSVCDEKEGIRFREYSIPQCQRLLPKGPCGSEPLPEGLFWLLVTGKMPTHEQVRALSKDWVSRATLPPHVATIINTFPGNLHPMAQFSAAITACSSESKFAKAYREGLHRSKYWELVFEDAMDLIAKLPTIAAMIYCNLYQDGKNIGDLDSTMDWAANFANQLRFENPQFTELLRLYLTIHSDHEGGNVSAHTCHVVGSALADPYLAFAAGMNGLAGPLHGLASQEALVFLNSVFKQLGPNYTIPQLREYVIKMLDAGQVIPGYGHAVLRINDPCYAIQREFGLKWLPNDPMFKLVSDVFKVVPEILNNLGKVKNPWPNIHAHSGVLLQYYGLTEMSFHTVLYGVSRSLGAMAQLIWARALEFPIERPKSISTELLIKWRLEEYNKSLSGRSSVR